MQNLSSSAIATETVCR